MTKAFENLSPCPFCGSEDVGPVMDPTQLGVPSHIECGHCMMRGPKAEEPEGAAVVWEELCKTTRKTVMF